MKTSMPSSNPRLAWKTLGVPLILSTAARSRNAGSRSSPVVATALSIEWAAGLGGIRGRRSAGRRGGGGSGARGSRKSGRGGSP